MVDLRARLHKEKDTKKTQTKYYNLYTQNNLYELILFYFLP